MRIHPSLIALVFVFTMAFAMGKDKKQPPPWNQWIEKDFPFFSCVVDARDEGIKDNLTPRAIVLPLGNGHYLAYDLDLLRVAVVWKAKDIPFDNAGMAVNSYPYELKKIGGGQGALPKPKGKILFQNGIYPGVGSGAPDFTDHRPLHPSKEELGRGGLDPKVARFKGIKLRSPIELEYEIGKTLVRERIRLGKDGLIRRLEIEPHEKSLYFALAQTDPDAPKFSCQGDGRIERIEDRAVCVIPASQEREIVSLVYPLPAKPGKSSRTEGLRWKDAVLVSLDQKKEEDALNFERIPLPLENPYARAVRAAGIDFFQDGRLALVTFDGDVWMGEGLRPGSKEVKWSRFASGLHEPLGLRLRDEEIFVFDRNGLWRLHDRDGNGEADYHELFCSQIDQTAETREFASALEVMKNGSFLVCKPGQTGSTIGRSSGAILRISPDGRKVTRLAQGFRQPYLGYDPVTDQIAATDQQGHFVPSTPITFVKKGSFYGHPNGDADKDRLVSPPLAWIPHQECGSAAAMLWMRNSKMGPLADQPVLVSFNPPRLFQVHPDSDEFVSQGGVTPLPLALDDPLLKGAVNPADGLLYLTGFNIWGTKAKGKTFLGRVRPNPKKVLPAPVDLRVGKRGILLRFARALDPKTANQTGSYSVRRWNYKRTPKYGSANYKLDGSPGTEDLPVSSIKLSKDKKAVFVGIPDMREVMQMEVAYDLRAGDGSPMSNKSFLTAHLLRKLALNKEGFANDQVDLKIVGSPTVAKRPPEPTLEKGKALYGQLGCIGCHSVDGTREGRTGPSWLGLFGSKRKLLTGETVIADEAYLKESILKPAAKVAEGAVNGEAGMPIYEGVLNEEQIQSIILYARSLGR
jgi:mono/diheme cytochrome c family protein